MGDNTSIEWTDATWNPLGGCTRVSEGCKNCYAEIMAARFSDPGLWGHGLAKRVTLPDGSTDHRWTGKIVLNEKNLDLPLRWKKGRKIFVNSTSDLFHEKVPDEWIDRIFAVMALCPQHTFQVLTKRPERMRRYLTDDVPRRIVGLSAARLRARAKGVHRSIDRFDIACDRVGLIDPLDHADIVPQLEDRCLRAGWPLPNVWLGTSVEDQATADTRIPHLLATPAAIRFISAEPLLGPVDLTAHLWGRAVPCPDCPRDADCDCGSLPRHMLGMEHDLAWVIVGGESGPGARPMHHDWAADIRDQCVAAGVPYFLKQRGNWSWIENPGDGQWPAANGNFIRMNKDGTRGPEGWPMQMVGKKAAGRLLDGRSWDAVPG